MKEQTLHNQICAYLRHQYPHVIFNTDLSGIKLTIGQARKLSLLRSSRAFPDIVIYEPRGKFKAMFLELKAKSPYKKDGKTLLKDSHLAEQQEMINSLLIRGYFADFYWSFDQAKYYIDEYLNMK